MEKLQFGGRGGRGQGGMQYNQSPSLFGNLSYAMPFSTFGGGADLDSGLKKLDVPLKTADEFSPLDVPVKTQDREIQKAFRESQSQNIRKIAETDPYRAQSLAKQSALQSKMQLEDPLNPTGRAKMNYELTLKAQEEDRKRLADNKINPTKYQDSEFWSEINYERKGNAGTYDEQGRFIPNTYEREFAPDNFNLPDKLKVIGDGYKKSMFITPDGRYDITSVSQEDNRGYIRDFYRKVEGVTADRVATYTAASLLGDTEFTNDALWEAKSRLLREKAQELGDYEVAGHWILDNPDELEKYSKEYVVNKASQIAGIETLKHSFVNVDMKTGTKADSTWGIGAKHKLENPLGFVVSSEGVSTAGIVIDLGKVQEQITTNKTQISTIERKIENGEELTEEELKNYDALKVQNQILEGEQAAYFTNYLDSDKGKEEINTTFENILFKGDENRKTEDGKIIAGYDERTALTHPLLGNIQSKEELQSIISGESQLDEKTLNKTFISSKVVGQGVIQETWTVRQALNKLKNQFNKPAEDYAKENPVSNKTNYLTGEKGGAIDKASNVVLNSIQAGNYTTGTEDVHNYLKNNVFTKAEIGWQDFDIQVKPGEEPIHGQQNYQLTLVPRTEAAKKAHTDTKEFNVVIFPKDNTVSLHGQIGNAIMKEQATSFIEVGIDGVERINHSQALAAPVNPYVIGSPQGSKTWATQEQKDLYKKGLFLESQHAVGNLFSESFATIQKRGGVENALTKAGGNPFLIPFSSITKNDGTKQEVFVEVKWEKTQTTRNGKTVTSKVPSYNLITQEGQTKQDYFIKEEIAKKYGNTIKNGIITSLKDLQLLYYIHNQEN